MDNLMLEKIKNFLTVPRIIFVILGIIILVELIYAVRVLVSPVSSRPVAKINVQPSAGKISLITPKTNYKVAEVVPVSVNIDTGSRAISGVDLIIQYDPEILEATKQGLVAGDILDEYPLMSVDSKKGLISISGISSLGSGFTGTGKFALINFRAKNIGSTPLTVNFEKNTTTASNLVEANTSKNILEEVDNLEITIE